MDTLNDPDAEGVLPFPSMTGEEIKEVAIHLSYRGDKLPEDIPELGLHKGDTIFLAVGPNGGLFALKKLSESEELLVENYLRKWVEELSPDEDDARESEL